MHSTPPKITSTIAGKTRLSVYRENCSFNWWKGKLCPQCLLFLNLYLNPTLRMIDSFLNVDCSHCQCPNWWSKLLAARNPVQPWFLGCRSKLRSFQCKTTDCERNSLSDRKSTAMCQNYFRKTSLESHKLSETITIFFNCLVITVIHQNLHKAFDPRRKTGKGAFIREGKINSFDYPKRGVSCCFFANCSPGTLKRCRSYFQSKKLETGQAPCFPTVGGRLQSPKCSQSWNSSSV